MKYRKKPIVVEAFQLNSRGVVNDRWFHDAVNENKINLHNFGRYDELDAWCEIKTLEGVMVAKTGDYIIRGLQGEIYPCKPEIFEQTYELVGDKTERVYRVHWKPDKVFKTKDERNAYIYGYGDGHEDGCSDGRAQALEFIDEVKSDVNKGYMFDMVDEIKNRVLALKGEQE